MTLLFFHPDLYSHNLPEECLQSNPDGHSYQQHSTHWPQDGLCTQSQNYPPACHSPHRVHLQTPQTFESPPAHPQDYRSSCTQSIHPLHLRCTLTSRPGLRQREWCLSSEFIQKRPTKSKLPIPSPCYWLNKSTSYREIYSYIYTTVLLIIL